MRATYYITGLCNYNCAYCDTSHERGTVPIEDVISFLKKYDISDLMISGGEPTLDSKLLLIIDSFPKAKKQLLTNLSGSAELYKNLQEKDVLIIASLHCSQTDMTKFTNKIKELNISKLRAYILAEHEFFEESLKAFREISSIIPYCELRHVDSDDVLEYEYEYNENQIKQIISCNSNIDITRRFKHKDKLYSYPEFVLKSYNKKTMLCNAGLTNIHIDNDGKVYPCQEIKKSIGTIYDEIPLRKTICSQSHCFCDLGEIY